MACPHLHAGGLDPHARFSQCEELWQGAYPSPLGLTSYCGHCSASGLRGLRPAPTGAARGPSFPMALRHLHTHVHTPEVAAAGAGGSWTNGVKSDGEESLPTPGGGSWVANEPAQEIPGRALPPPAVASSILCLCWTTSRSAHLRAAGSAVRITLLPQGHLGGTRWQGSGPGWGHGEPSPGSDV